MILRKIVKIHGILLRLFYFRIMTQSELGHLTSSGRKSIKNFMNLSRTKKRLASQLMKQRLNNSLCEISHNPKTCKNQDSALRKNGNLNQNYFNIESSAENSRKAMNSPFSRFEEQSSGKSHNENIPSVKDYKLIPKVPDHVPKIKAGSFVARKKRFGKIIPKSGSYLNLEKDKSEKIKLMERNREVMISSKQIFL